MNVSIIYNPHAGTRDMQRHIRQAGNLLQQRGWTVNWQQTTRAGEATQLARRAARRGDDVAVAAGGDGTINEVMNGLVGSDTALGILPAGTGNVFASDMHIPTPGPLAPQALLKAAHALLTGQTRRIDVARATLGDGTARHFLLWAGIGLDAAVSRAVEAETSERPTMKSLGLAAWFVAGFLVLREFRGSRMNITVDGEVINRRVVMTTINNSQLYGRFWRLSPEAKLDDGLLDVVVMEGYGFRSSLKHILLATLGRHAKDPAVHLYRATHIQIETKEPMPVHLDAENVGVTPLTVDVVPKSLTIILPQNVPHYHFTSIDALPANHRQGERNPP
ncbi:MAG: diacylglycerol/lipid kinase family protein [Anaerolineae bacterium]